MLNENSKLQRYFKPLIKKTVKKREMAGASIDAGTDWGLC